MNHLVDIYATKGIEYLVLIGFLALMVPAWMLLRPRRAARPAERPLLRQGSGWFPVAQDRWYHPGHTWAMVEEDGSVRVGLDALAARLLGIPDDIDVSGPSVSQGEAGAHLSVGGHRFGIAAPVDGEVLETNPALAERPALLVEDPYDQGWLLRVRPQDIDRSLRNLSAPEVTAAALALAEDSLRAHLAPDLGEVLQDGGEPVPGALRHLDPEAWERLARQLLRCAEEGA